MSAPLPDTRTPGQVMWDAVHDWPDAEPWGYRAERNAKYERYAAAVLAHDAAQRAARGEVVVDRDCLSSLLFWCRDDHDPDVWTMAHGYAAVAAPTPKETDR